MERETSVPGFCKEDAMSINEQVDRIVWVQEEKQGLPPSIKLLLAFVIGLAVLSPAILGIYWELLLP